MFVLHYGLVLPRSRSRNEVNYTKLHHFLYGGIAIGPSSISVLFS